MTAACDVFNLKLAIYQIAKDDESVLPAYTFPPPSAQVSEPTTEPQETVALLYDPVAMHYDLICPL